SGYKGNGGALSTGGGLVFHQGGDGTLQAYDARTGETLWKFQTDFAGGDAPPMSYAIDGKQYVAFVAGTKVWAFTLGGKLPPGPDLCAGDECHVLFAVDRVAHRRHIAAGK